jgi:hypothetical protein
MSPENTTNPFDDESIPSDWSATEEEPDDIQGSDPLMVAFRDYRALKDEKGDLNEKLAAINQRMDQLERRIVDTMDARGVTMLRSPGIGTFSVVAAPFPRVIDPAGLVEWLDANGEGGLAPRKVNANTLRAWCKERMSSEEALPPDNLVDLNPSRCIRMRRA